MQTGLKSDGFCDYNQAATQFFWTMQPGQYYNTYTYGEVGVPANGGAAGSYVRKDVIDIDSFLSGRDNTTSKCIPPAPSLQDLDAPVLHEQSLDAQNFLIPMYTKELRSETDLSAIDFDRWTYLPSDPQNLRHVIEETAASRGGVDTRNFVKLAWNPRLDSSEQPINKEGFSNILNKSNTYNNTYPTDSLCMLTLDPQRVCGPECAKINGYPGITDVDVRALNVTKPPNHEYYPFTDITSQQLVQVGAAPCGPNYFYGDKYQYGSCPVITPNHNFS